MPEFIFLLLPENLIAHHIHGFIIALPFLKVIVMQKIFDELFHRPAASKSAPHTQRQRRQCCHCLRCFIFLSIILLQYLQSFQERKFL